MKFKSNAQRKAVMSSIRSRGLTPPSFKTNRLPVQVSIGVPSTTAQDKKVSQKVMTARVNFVKKWFSSNFGGDTSVESMGSYVMDGKLIKEKVVMVESSMSKAMYEKKRVQIQNLVKTLQVKYGQDTMLMKIEGETFIYPKKNYIGHDKKQEGKMIRVS